MPEPVQAPKSFKPLQNTPIPIRAIAFQHLASKLDHEVFSVSFRDIKHALKPKIKTDPAIVLLEVYKEFLKVFSHEEANKLPPARPGVDHIIRMQPGTQPPARLLYDMSRNELKVLKEYLKDNLSKEYIGAFSSLAAAPVLFVKKPGGDLRFCVDYRGLNELTIKNKYSLPLIQETLDRLCKGIYFTKLDIIAAFNKIQIAAEAEWKTAFRTRLGLYKYLVTLIEALNQDLETIISQAYQDIDPEDPVAIISQMIMNGEHHSRQYSLSDYSLDSRCLYHYGKLYLPNQELLCLRILQKSYNLPMTRHPGVARTYEILQGSYYWPKMVDSVRQYIRNCLHAQEPSMQEINKESYFPFWYRHSHGKSLPWTLSQSYQCLWMLASHIHFISGLSLTV